MKSFCMTIERTDCKSARAGCHIDVEKFCKDLDVAEKSRSDDTLLTAGFNLRTGSTTPSIKSCKDLDVAEKSRSDDTLLTAGFNLRTGSMTPSIKSCKDDTKIAKCRLCETLACVVHRFHRLKPVVNKVPSLRDFLSQINRYLHFNSVMTLFDVNRMITYPVLHWG